MRLPPKKTHSLNALVRELQVGGLDAYETISVHGSQAVIPPRSNRVNPRTFDRHIYKSRNLIERFFCRIKQFRRIATRYDKLAKSFLSFVHLASTIVWLA
jgi:transposase